MEVDILSLGRTPFHLLKPTNYDYNQGETKMHCHTLSAWEPMAITSTKWISPREELAGRSVEEYKSQLLTGMVTMMYESLCHTPELAARVLINMRLLATNLPVYVTIPRLMGFTNPS